MEHATSRRSLLTAVGAALAAGVLGSGSAAEAAVRRPSAAQRAAARRAAARRAAAARQAAARRAAAQAAAKKAAAQKAAAAKRAAAQKAAAAKKAAAQKAAKKAAAQKAAAQKAAAQKAAAQKAAQKAAADAAARADAERAAERAQAQLTGASGLLSTDPVLHLLRRTTFGPTPESVAQVRALGISGWLDRQLAPDTIDDSTCDRYLQAFPTLGMTPPQVRSAAPNNGSWYSMNEVVRGTLVRQAWSERQVFEVMVEFWNNHLNVTCPSSEVWDNRADYDRTVIRRHALGRYRDMLQAAARHPAMLRYLDGATSRAPQPNENYGRELLELHTVGIEAGYTDDDMRDSARVLTGLSVWNHWDKGVPAGVAGTYRYRSEFHHVGPVRVLDWSHANGSAAGGEAVITSYLDHLARHPATARRIARKLCVRFLSDTPAPGLVEELARVYLAHDTAIVPVLRALLASPDFAASVGHKTKRPVEDVVGTLRVLGVQPLADVNRAAGHMVWSLAQMGQAPLGWAPPNGYPDVAGAWASPVVTLNSWNTHLGLTQGWWKAELTVPALKTLLGAPTTAGELIDRLAERLLFQPLRPQDRTALLTFLGLSSTDPASKKGADGGLLPVLAALLLDSPAWRLR